MFELFSYFPLLDISKVAYFIIQMVNTKSFLSQVHLQLTEYSKLIFLFSLLML